LVDGFHNYECTSQDLIAAWRLLRDDGILVVHDCAPDNRELSQPEFRSGAWCGLTYTAFIDFVLPRRHVAYYTVDCDFGCGFIYKNQAPAHLCERQDDRSRLEFEWRAVAGSWCERYEFFNANRAALLNLISPEEFLALEGLDPLAQPVAAGE